MNQAFSYTGKEELEQAKFLPRYNLSIAKQLMRVMKPDQILMDFGAGTGTISELIRIHAKPQKLICLEIDEENRKALEEKKFDVIGDIEQCADESVDVVFSSDVLEHIEDDVAALKNIYRKLKPGGYASFWVPACTFLWTAMDDRVGHYRRYSRKQMIAVFEAAGFTVERCAYQDCAGVPVKILFKLVGNKEARATEKNLQFYDSVIVPLSSLFDLLFSRIIGKNLIMHAHKPDQPPSPSG